MGPESSRASALKAAASILSWVDDRRIGLIVRASRRRRRMRQLDLADAAGVSQATISRLERGHLDRLSLAVARRILHALDARVELEVRWRGGAADRLVDDRGAAVGVAVTRSLHDDGWEVLPEVTFRRYGDRGSIDLDTSTNRRRSRAIETLVRAGLPAGSRSVRAWLRTPVGSMKGLIDIAEGRV